MPATMNTTIREINFQSSNSMNRRLVLLPGFGEDERIFRNIIPYFSDFQIEIVNYQNILPQFTRYNVRLERFIRKLVQVYGITKDDILIGHSMGGYLAHHVRQMVGCEACLHSSFVHPSKINFLVNNQFLVQWTIQNGLFQWDVFKLISNWRYLNKPSAQEVQHAVDLLNEYGSLDLLKLTLLFFKRKRRFMNWLRSTPDYELVPSLIIHPDKDKIVAAPDEEHFTVEGDHFSIATHPEQSAKILRNWLNQITHTHQHHLSPTHTYSN